MSLATQTTTAAAGSVAATELTAEQVQKILVQPLEAASVFLAADTAGPLRTPKAPGLSDVSFVGENELIPEVNPDFDEVQLLPSTMKSLKTLTATATSWPASRSSPSTRR